MTLADNLRRIREERGHSQAGLAKLARVSQQLISRLESGRDQTTKKLPALATALGVLVTELDPAYVVEVASPDIVLIPRLSWVSAGALRPHVSIEDLSDWPKVAAIDLPKGDWIALEVEGDSMDRISPPGSLIFVNRNDRRLVANACYVIADEQGEATYKRYRPNPDRFEPVSLNPAYEPLYPDNEPVIIGRVKRSVIDM